MDSERHGDEPISGKSRMTAIRNYLQEDITESWADLILIATCFIAGIIDSAVFNVWSCFVSMQTGNTVYVGLGVSGQPESQPYRWAKSLTAIVFFSVGTYFFSRLTRLCGPLRRSTMIMSTVLQAALCFAAAALVQTKVVPHDAGDQLPHNFIVLLPLGMLSFQSGGQMVMSRMLAFNEIPTVVLTSTYCDLMFDPNLFTSPLTQNSKRNRRFISVVALVVGAMVGGLLTADKMIESALWLCGALKIAISIVWCFWKAQGSIRLD